MEQNSRTRENFINDAIYDFRGGMSRKFYYMNMEYPFIPYYYDPNDDCIHADAVCVPFHYKEEDITYRVIGETLDVLENALKEYFKKEKGITLYDYD